MAGLPKNPIYGQLFPPFRFALVFIGTYFCVIVGNKILVKNSKYFGLS